MSLAQKLLIFLLLLYDSTLFYLVYLQPQPTSDFILGKRVSPTVVTILTLPPSHTPTFPVVLNFSTVPSPTPLPSLTLTFSPTPVNSQPTPSSTPVLTLNISPTLFNTPSPSPLATPTYLAMPSPSLTPSPWLDIKAAAVQETASQIGEILTDPGRFLQLYDFFNQDLKETFSTEDWQKAISQIGFTIENMQLVGAIEVNGEWATQKIELKTSRGEMLHFLMVFRKEKDGIWKLFGTLPL